MRLIRLLIAMLLFVALVSFARAEDAPEATPEGAQDAAPLVNEGTESVMIIDTTEAPAEVTSEPAPEELPATVINNNGFSFEQVFVLILGFVLTIFAVLRAFLMPALKANAELAKQAGDLVPETALDKMIGANDAALQLARTLTPGFKGDDIALEKLRAEFVEWKSILHPLIAQLTAPQPSIQNMTVEHTNLPPGWVPATDDAKG